MRLLFWDQDNFDTKTFCALKFEPFRVDLAYNIDNPTPFYVVKQHFSTIAHNGSGLSFFAIKSKKNMILAFLQS